MSISDIVGRIEIALALMVLMFPVTGIVALLVLGAFIDLRFIRKSPTALRTSATFALIVFSFEFIGMMTLSAGGFGH